MDSASRMLRFGGRSIGCVIGRSGAIAATDKREGDGATPRGDWPVRGVLLRPDAGLPPPTALPWRWLRTDDGWSDDGADPAYNQPVRHPHRFSAERLWRDDTLYDAILVLGYNDRPPCPGAGSAIFLHLALGPVTEGCVAVSRETMIELLAGLCPGARVHIA